MEQPLLIKVQLNVLTLEDHFADISFHAQPKTSTLNRIRARARAVRPL